jgi:phage gpG-like protein
MITAVIIGDRQYIAKLQNFAPRLRDQILNSTRRLEFMMVAKVKGKLSGEVLKNRTNHLRGSIHGEVRDLGDKIEGITGTNVVYARIHEYGGTINHPGGTAYFFNGSRCVFARNDSLFAQIMKRTKAHKIPIPERSFLRSSLREMRPTIINEYEKAVSKAAQNGS